MIPYYQFSSWNVGGITFHVWGACAGLAFVAASLLFQRYAPKTKTGSAGLFAVSVFVAGLVGARIAYVVSSGEITSFASGGLGFVGGLLAGLGMALILIRVWKWPLGATLDALAPALAAGYAIGRIGCFLIHDHLGKSTNMIWGIRFEGQTFHETSLYSFINGVFLFSVLTALIKRKHRTGLIAATFLVLYSAIRFVIEFFQVGPYLVGLTHTQLLLIPIALISAFILWRIQRSTLTASGL